MHLDIHQGQSVKKIDNRVRSWLYQYHAIHLFCPERACFFVELGRLSDVHFSKLINQGFSLSDNSSFIYDQIFFKPCIYSNPAIAQNGWVILIPQPWQLKPDQ